MTFGIEREVDHHDRVLLDDVFVKAEYRRKHYRIADDDFDSKFAFSLLQNLIDLAKTDQSAKAPLVTIPAG